VNNRPAPKRLSDANEQATRRPLPVAFEGEPTSVARTVRGQGGRAPGVHGGEARRGCRAGPGADDAAEVRARVLRLAADVALQEATAVTQEEAPPPVAQA
jgi:hypothetical protein